MTAEERNIEIQMLKKGNTTTDMGPREFTNKMRESEEESSKENSKDSRIMVKLGG